MRRGLLELKNSATNVLSVSSQCRVEVIDLIVDGATDQGCGELTQASDWNNV
jgi:hypothetical protein